MYDLVLFRLFLSFRNNNCCCAKTDLWFHTLQLTPRLYLYLLHSALYLLSVIKWMHDIVFSKLPVGEPETIISMSVQLSANFLTMQLLYIDAKMTVACSLLSKRMYYIWGGVATDSMATWQCTSCFHPPKHDRNHRCVQNNRMQGYTCCILNICSTNEWIMNPMLQ